MRILREFIKKHWPVIAGLGVLIGIITGLKALGFFQTIKSGFAWLFKDQGEMPFRFEGFIDLPVQMPLWVLLILFCIAISIIPIIKAIKKFFAKKKSTKESYDEDFFWGIYWQWDTYWNILDHNCELTARCPICKNLFDTIQRHSSDAVTGCCLNCKFPKPFSLNRTLGGARKEIDRRIHCGDAIKFKDHIRYMNDDFPKLFKAALAGGEAEKKDLLESLQLLPENTNKISKSSVMRTNQDAGEVRRR